MYIGALLFSISVCVFSVEWLVLDEADKLFEDGPTDSGFRNQVHNKPSLQYCNTLGEPLLCVGGTDIFCVRQPKCEARSI